MRNATKDFTIAFNCPILQWLHGIPTIEKGKLYVISFQRLANDLILGDLAITYPL